MQIDFELLWGVQLGMPRPAGPQGFLQGDLEAAEEAEAKEERLQVRVCAWHANLSNDPIFKMQTEARGGWTTGTPGTPSEILLRRFEVQVQDGSHVDSSGSTTAVRSASSSLR